MRDFSDINKLVDSLTIEEMCGQVLCYDIQPEDKVDETNEVIKRIHMGSIFVTPKTCEKNRLQDYVNQDFAYEKLVEETTGIPCLTATDVEHGPGSYCPSLPSLPNPMAWGACNDEKLIQRAGELTGRICRKMGIQYILGPVVDLNINFRNALVSVRSISDNADRVIKLAGAYLKGVQKNGYLAGCLKHFPGDGVDERNQHFLTSVNSLSKENWMNTYGKVYKEMFKQGAKSVMVGHISCPAFQEGEIDEYGALPCSLSKKLITDLLKGELGFKGCVISDAMSMIGACARVPENKLAVEFIKAGGDLMLFPRPEEYSYLIDAVKSGEIEIDRLKDAVRRVLLLKQSVRLFENKDICEEIGDTTKDIEELSLLSQQIADNAIKVVRNNQNVIPYNGENKKVLLIKLTGTYFHTEPKFAEFESIEDEFAKNGYYVTSLYNPKHHYLKSIMNDYGLVVIAMKSNFHGATMRVGWDNIMPLWRAYILQHPRCIFVGLDDPYKLFDFPYAKTYINTFGAEPSLQRALVKTIIGKISPKSKNPITFEGYFNRED